MSDYWIDALNGIHGPVHDGDPQPGYYRTNPRGGVGQPVVIYDDAGVMKARIGIFVMDANDVWFDVCQWPITIDVYESVRAGNPWPESILKEPRTRAARAKSRL
jgi:hypothetical protein